MTSVRLSISSFAKPLVVSYSRNPYSAVLFEADDRTLRTVEESPCCTPVETNRYQTTVGKQVRRQHFTCTLGRLAGSTRGGVDDVGSIIHSTVAQ